jgi:hypothetical protein
LGQDVTFAQYQDLYNEVGTKLENIIQDPALLSCHMLLETIWSNHARSWISVVVVDRSEFWEFMSAVM